MLPVAGEGAGQAEQPLVVAAQAFVVELAVAVQEDRLLDGLEAALLRVGRQPEEVADEIGDLQLFLVREDLSQSDDVVEDCLANLAVLLLDCAEDVCDLFEQEGGDVAL